MGHRGIAGHAGGDARRLTRGAPGHQPLDALVDIAQTLFQPPHRLAVGGEAEMAGFDDAGVDRADGDLVQPLPLGGQKGVVLGFGCCRPRRGGQRVGHAPQPVIQPGPRVHRPVGHQPEQVAGRALQPDHRRAHGAQRREMAVRAVQRHHRDVARQLLAQGHMDRRRLTPETHHRQGVAAQRLHQRAPAARRGAVAGKRAVPVHRLADAVHQAEQGIFTHVHATPLFLHPQSPARASARLAIAGACPFGYRGRLPAGPRPFSPTGRQRCGTTPPAVPAATPPPPAPAPDGRTAAPATRAPAPAPRPACRTPSAAPA